MQAGEFILEREVLRGKAGRMWILVTDQGKNWSKMQNEVLSAPFPMIFGSPSVVDGYCSLELGERDIALETLRQHRVECALWYRALKLLVDPLLGEWAFPTNSDEKSNLLLRANLVCLEVSSAKASLDLLLSGYYSLCFASIRHMMEAVAQVMYLMQFPAKAHLWEPGEKPPQMRVMINEVKKALKLKGFEAGESERFERLYDTWALMSKGSHPTGEGLVQVTATEDDPRNIIGPVYRQNLALVAFDHGLFSLEMLLYAIPTLNRADSIWTTNLSQWKVQRREWNTKVRQDETLSYLWEEEQAQIVEALAEANNDAG